MMIWKLNLFNGLIKFKTRWKHTWHKIAIWNISWIVKLKGQIDMFCWMQLQLECKKLISFCNAQYWCDRLMYISVCYALYWCDDVVAWLSVWRSGVHGQAQQPARSSRRSELDGGWRTAHHYFGPQDFGDVTQDGECLHTSLQDQRTERYWGSGARGQLVFWKLKSFQWNISSQRILFSNW